MQKPRSSIDDVIDVYRRDVDVAMLEENLRLTHAERLEKFEALMADLFELRAAASGPAPHDPVVSQAD